MILAIGPYIGSFEQEIMTFQPYARWLNEVIKAETIFLNVHHNRRWLYDFIEDDNIISVFEHLTRDELKQQGYVHTDVKQKDFLLISREFKNEIIKRHNENILKKDIKIFNLPYMKNSPPIPFYNKIFEPLSIPDINIEGNIDIVFIPCSNEKKGTMKYIYNHLKENYNCIVVGDMGIHFMNDNIILSYIDYCENVYKYILSYISKARAVICPLSHWTFLCNLQNIPVFSWGKHVGQYREDGMYHFDNNKCMTMTTSKKQNVKNITDMIDYFIEKL